MHCNKRSLTEDDTGEEGSSSSKQRCLSPPITEEDGSSSSEQRCHSPPITEEEGSSSSEQRCHSPPITEEDGSSSSEQRCLSPPITEEEGSSSSEQRCHSPPITEEEGSSSSEQRCHSPPITEEEGSSSSEQRCPSPPITEEEGSSSSEQRCHSPPITDVTFQNSPSTSSDWTKRNNDKQEIPASITPENCISMYNRTKQNDILNYILINFRLVMKHIKHPYELDVETMVEILTNDYLNVADEYSLYKFMCSWIDEDPSNREQHTLRLLKCLRLGRNKYLGPEVRDTFERLCPNTKQRYPNDILFLFGGKSPKRNGRRPRHPYVHVFDKCANEWFPLTNVSAPDLKQKQCGVGVLNNIVYLVGGIFKKRGSPEHNINTNKVTCFDPEKKLWWASACMFFARSELCVVTCNGLLYAIGGSFLGASLNRGERYDPCTEKWSKIATLKENRRSAGSAELHGKIYVAGGEGNACTLRSVEVYSPDTDQWTNITPMEIPRYGLCCVAYGDAVFAIGGADHYKQVERYVAQGEEPKWEYFNTIYERRWNFSAVIMDDAIFAIGGIEKSGWHYESMTMTTEKFSFGEENRNSWEPWFSMLDPIYNHNACVISGLKNAKEYSFEDNCAKKDAACSMS